MHEWNYPHFHSQPPYSQPPYGQPPHHLHHPHDERIDRFKETAEWRPRYRADYSPHGDTLDMFARKVYAELETVYHLLNRLRKMDASAGDLADTVPYQLRVDTASGRLLIRDSKNQNWIELGKLDKSFFGIEPEDIGAVRNAGTIGAFHSGDAANLPTVAGIHDIFYALDEKKIYYYSGTSWELLASLDFADFYGYDAAITADDISSTGEAGKIVSLDSDGVIHANLDGKLITARKIAIAGDAEGAAYFDGSEDTTINLAITKPVAEAISASSAISDGAGNVISETYAKKAELSDFVTTEELTAVVEDSEPIFREDILSLFDKDTFPFSEDMPSVWDDFDYASENDILKIFGTGV